MIVQPRPEIVELPAYRPGRPAPIKLASNENPHPPLPSVLKAINAAAATLNRYPDTAATELTEALARRFEVTTEQVATGCGSVTVCQQLIGAFAGSDDEVVHAWRSFEAYPLITQIAGVHSSLVPLRQHTHDLDAMLGAITDKTRVVLVCNPNNPTGTVVRRAELESFLADVPERVLVILDEAYTEYVADPDVPDGIELMRGRPNVAVLRTFSKAYGLAALRVGYLIAEDPEVAGLVRKTMMPFSVSTIAQVAAIASLAAEAELRERVGQTVAERDRVGAALRAAGWEVPDSQGNFIWLPAAQRTDEIAERLMAHDIMGRPFTGEGIRITIGTREENDALLSALGG